MRAAGETRKIDKVGRLNLPLRVLKEVNLNRLDEISIDSIDDGIIVTKAKKLCVVCREEIVDIKDLIIFKGKKLCKNCLNGIKEL